MTIKTVRLGEDSERLLARLLGNAGDPWLGRRESFDAQGGALLLGLPKVVLQLLG